MALIANRAKPHCTPVLLRVLVQHAGKVLTHRFLLKEL
jgi:hypothetical protein